MDDQTQITYIGRVDHRNKMTKFGIKPKDRTKHMYVIGKTGTGKSTFLENMIVQDIQNGHGVAFIDPHGGSAEKLLDYIPEWRINDVIYFNPSDLEFPVSFNPLEDPGPEKRHLVTDGLMSVFKKIWPEAFSGRMEYILNMTMMALLEYPDSTVLSINRMLTDKDFRKKVIAAITDSAVRNAWDELSKWDDKRWSEAIGALVNKVGQFSTNPIIRNIIGQPKSTFDFRKAMDERKIVIINLSKGMIGEQNAPLLGAMLITKIYLSAMSRAELQGHVIEKMPPFYFYVDEFQNFANESFASILSEARKYKLCLTVANQFIAQMEETIRDAVFGNMGTTVSFRVGPLDAEFMERVFAPVFTQEDLQNIAFGQYYLTLQIDNMGSKPFSAQGLPPIPPLQTSMRQEVIDASRRNYASNRADIEAAVNEFFGYNKKTIHSETVTGAGTGTNSASAGTGSIPSAPKQDFKMSGGTAVYVRPDTHSNAPRPPRPDTKFDAKPGVPVVKPDYNRQQNRPDQKSARPEYSAQKSQTIQTPQTSQVPQVPQVVPQAPQAAPAVRAVEQTQYKEQNIPPISGFKKDDPKAEVKKSSELDNLLSQWDDAVIVADTKTEPKTIPKTEEKVAPKVISQNEVKVEIKVDEKAQIKTEVKPPAVKTFPPKLDRAASTEKKSALQEALARAMAKTATPPSLPETDKQSEPSQQQSFVQPVATPVVSTPVPVREPVPPPPIPPIPPPMPATPMPSVPVATYTAPVIPAPVSTPRPVVNETQKQVREVPEDILRKVLE